jgi:ABC-type Fe3+-hydroxamate transport system substrate-binding protein
MISVIDQMGKTVTLNGTPQRIVSLVPSQTELLYYLGLIPVGQTVFCIHPSDKFKSANKIGGTKNLNIDAIRALNPDLIIGNKEENNKDQINVLEQEFPVWMSDVNSLDDAYEMIYKVGLITGKLDKVEKLNGEILAQFNRLITPKSAKPTVLYLIWDKPYFGVGNNTFIHDILSKAGLLNVLESSSRYPELDDESIFKMNPDYIFLSSEPFPFAEKHLDLIQSKFSASKVILVDGEAFSWYGNRLLDTPQYIEKIISDIRSYESQS